MFHKRMDGHPTAQQGRFSIISYLSSMANQFKYMVKQSTGWLKYVIGMRPFIQSELGKVMRRVEYGGRRSKSWVDAALIKRSSLLCAEFVLGQW